MTKLFVWLFEKFVKNANKFKLVEDKINLSVADIEKSRAPRIVLYGIKGCPVCKEMKLFFDNNWVPHKYLECKKIIPVQIPKLKHLLSYSGFYVKYLDTKHRLFLMNVFPQIDLISEDNKWSKLVGQNTKDMRNAIEKFIAGNIKFFPGFESGIFNDKMPGEQAAEQLGQLVRKAKENVGTPSNPKNLSRNIEKGEALLREIRERKPANNMGSIKKPIKKIENPKPNIVGSGPIKTESKSRVQESTSIKEKSPSN